MKIPFTTEQFLGVFAAYNQSVWPAQVALFAAALVILGLSLKTFSFSSIVSGSIMGVLWIWMGIAYHIVLFTSINPAAYIFGVACILQGLIFFWKGIRKTLEFHFSSNVRGWTGGLLIFYALILYPILGFHLGHVYPSSPTFGLPCPTTIFTFGMLLWVRKPPLPDHSRSLVCSRIFCSASTGNQGRLWIATGRGALDHPPGFSNEDNATGPLTLSDMDSIGYYMKRILFLTSILATAVYCQPRYLSSQEAFAVYATEFYGKKLPGTKVTKLQNFSLSFQLPDKEPAILFLDNPFLACKSQPSDCDTTLLKYLPTPDSADLKGDRSSIRPMLKSREYASQLQRMFDSGPKKQKAPTTPFIGDITILYAFEFPERMAVVDEEDMRAVGARDVESLHRLALSNIEARTGELAYKEIQPGSGIYALTYEDSLAPSRVLLQDKWAAVARKIKGNPILAIPSREFVLFVAEGDATRVRSLRELVRKVFSGEDHAVSMQLMRWTPGGWELYSEEQ